MPFIVRKKRIISILFLVCFVFYTVSPLSSICVENDMRDSYEKSAGLSIKGIRLVLLELFVSVISPQTGQDGRSAAVTFLLLKKKRAVVPPRDHADTVAVSIPEHTAPLINTYPPLPVPVTVSLQDEPKPLDGFHLLHSGLSPPSAERSFEKQSAGASFIQINS